MTDDWIEGLPPEGEESAWLKIALPDEEGGINSVVILAVRDNENWWSEAADWRGESYKDEIEGVIMAWMPHKIPAV